MNIRTIGIGIVAVALILAISMTASAVPESSGSDAATGGTITSVDHGSATTQTQHWAGYYGDVGGSIRLGDVGSEMYKWSANDDVGGEVYASTASSIAWASIVAESGANVDNNVSYLSGASDSATTTFSTTNSADITVGTTTVALGDASATHTYVNGTVQTTSFEEAILYDGTNIVWTAIISPNTDGFESGYSAHDYQMIVPENEEGATAATTYYFFVELE